MENKRSILFSLVVLAAVAMTSGAGLRAPAVKPSVEAKPVVPPDNPASSPTAVKDGIGAAPADQGVASKANLGAAKQPQVDESAGTDGTETMSLPGPKIFKPKVWKRGKHAHVKRKHTPGPKYFKPKVLKTSSDAAEKATHSDTTFVADVDSDDEDSSDLGDDDDGEPIALENNSNSDLNNNKGHDTSNNGASSVDVDHNSSVFAAPKDTSNGNAVGGMGANGGIGAGAAVDKVGGLLGKDDSDSADSDDKGDNEDDDQDDEDDADAADEEAGAQVASDEPAKTSNTGSTSASLKQQPGSKSQKSDVANRSEQPSTDKGHNQGNAEKGQTTLGINAGEKERSTVSTPSASTDPAALAQGGKKASSSAAAQAAVALQGTPPGGANAIASNEKSNVDAQKTGAGAATNIPAASNAPVASEKSTANAPPKEAAPAGAPNQITAPAAGSAGAAAMNAAAAGAVALASAGNTATATKATPTSLKSALASLVPGQHSGGNSDHTALSEGDKQHSSTTAGQSEPAASGTVEKTASVQKGPFVASVSQAAVPDKLRKGNAEPGTMATAPGAKDELPQAMPPAAASTQELGKAPHVKPTGDTAKGQDKSHSGVVNEKQAIALGGKVLSSSVAAVPEALNAALSGSTASASASITASKSPQEPASGPEVSKTPTAPDGSTIPVESPYHLSKQAVLTIDNHLPEVVDKTEDLVPDSKEDGEDTVKMDVVGGLTEGIPKKPTQHVQALIDACKLKCEAQAIKDDEAEVVRLENNEKQIVKVENMKGGPESGNDDDDDVTVGKDVVSTNLLQLGSTVKARVQARMEACMKFDCPYGSHTTADGQITQNGKLDTNYQTPKVVQSGTTSASTPTQPPAPTSGADSARPQETKGPVNPVPVTLAEAIGEKGEQEFHGGSVTLADAMAESSDKVME